MTTIKTYVSAVEADVDRSIPEANGVKCHLADESSSVVGIGALGLRLQVDDVEAERARDILRNQYEGVSPMPEADSEPAPHESGRRKSDLIIVYAGFGILLLVILLSILMELIFGR